MEYEEYLRSPEWRAKREWALERAGRRCQVCNSGNALDVHHRTYENVGHELPADLTVLCRTCHGRHHGSRAERRPPKLPAIMGAERTLVFLMVKSRDLIERVTERVAPEDFADPAFRAIFEALVADPELRSPPPAMDPVAAKRLEELLAGNEEPQHPRQMLDDTLQRLQIEAVRRETAEIDRQIAEASEAGERAALVWQREQLAERRKQIGRDHSAWASRVRALGTDER